MRRNLLFCALWIGLILSTIRTCEVEASSPDIRVTYSSYNDLDLQYTLTDMTETKNLNFELPDATIAAGSTPVVINPSITYQKWEGFGGSIDGASVYNMLQLNNTERAALLSDLFGEGGNQYNMMRLCIGCSDFTIDAPEAASYGNYGSLAGGGYWTYDDVTDEDTDGDGVADADFDLSNFTIQGDVDSGEIGLLQSILQVNPDVKFFASMWSAPAWMKKNGSIIWESGQFNPELKEDCYEVLAEYYCKYIEAYQILGIEIYAVTLQNEPDVKIGYPCTLFTPENQIRFAGYLAAAFQRHNIDTVIWGMDTNEYETWSYAVPLLESSIGGSIEGIGFHNYGGITMYYPNSLKEQFPDKTFHVTEMTVGGTKLVEYLRNNISSYAYWITYYDIDQANHTYGPGPSFWSMPRTDDADHWSLSQVSDDGSGSYQLNSKYYTFGQFSRFIDVGAVRIASSEESGNISNVAFQNPDGSISMVVVNHQYDQHTNSDPNTPAQQICIITPDGEFYDTIPGDTIATYCWHPATGDSLEETNWTATTASEHEGFKINQAIDPDAVSTWFSGKTQASGDDIELDLGSATYFTQISLINSESYITDYPGSYTVSTSLDGSNWIQTCTGFGTSGITNITLPGTVYARYLKIELNSSKDNWWSISDVAIFNSGTTSSAQTPYQYARLTNRNAWTVQASSNRVTEDPANEIVDGDNNTVWTYQAAQTEGYYLQADLAAIQEFNKITVDFGANEDYARAFQLYTSVDGVNWSTFGDEIHVSPVRDSSGNVVSTSTAVTGDSVNARYIRMVLTQNVADHWLRVAELSVAKVIYNTTTSYSDRTGWFSVSQLYNWSDRNQNMFDGDISTRWTNGKAQESGDSVNFDMLTVQQFNTLTMECGTDYARGYRILASMDGSTYTEIAAGASVTGTTVVSFDTLQSAKCIRIELTDTCSNSWWSIYELNLGITATNSSEEVLDKTGWSSNTCLHGIEVEKYAIDDDLSTVWVSEESQIYSDAYTTGYLVNLGSSNNICGISINSGSEMWSYLENYKVYAWEDGEEAKLVAEGTGNEAVTQIYFAPVNAKYIWIRAASNSISGRKFAIAELNVYTK